jgi:streptogramin lyase
MVLFVVCVSVTAGFGVAGPSSAAAVEITEFKNTLNPAFAGIAGGPEGNLWFTGSGSIGRITPAGVINKFTEGLGHESLPFDIVEASDDTLWFTDRVGAIGRVSALGVSTEFKVGLNAGSLPEEIVRGADGSVWFVDGGAMAAIGRATPDGTIEEFSENSVEQHLNTGSKPTDIAAGPDGSIWFTDDGTTPAIGHVKPDGTIEEISNGLNGGGKPGDISAGSDGNIWFSDDGTTPAIGHVEPDGTIEEISNGLNGGSKPGALTSGPDGNMWFTDRGSTEAIGQITPSGAIAEFDAGLNSTNPPDDITAAADGNLWVEQSTPVEVARITPAGVITEFSTGVEQLTGSSADRIIKGPEGNPWFSALGVEPVIGKVDLQLATPSTSGGTTTTSSSTTTAPPPALPKLATFLLTKTTFDNQQLILTTPPRSACTASARTLPVKFNSVTITNSPGPKLRFVSAGLYVDRGVAKKHRVTIRSHGKRKTVTVVVFGPNTKLGHVPATVALRIGAQRRGAHTLSVKALYKKTVTEHGRKKTVTVNKTLSTPFRVC